MAVAYTDPPNPCEGIKSDSLAKPIVHITDEMFAAIYAHAGGPLQDAMDLTLPNGPAARLYAQDERT